jgi:hypothetical protein
MRRRSLDALDRINQGIAEGVDDPETITRIAQDAMRLSDAGARHWRLRLETEIRGKPITPSARQPSTMFLPVIFTSR